MHKRLYFFLTILLGCFVSCGLNPLEFSEQEASINGHTSVAANAGIVDVPDATYAAAVDVPEEAYAAAVDVPDDAYAAAVDAPDDFIIENAAEDVFDCMAAYQSTLDSLVYDDEEPPRFALCYMDEDNVPELVIYTELQKNEDSPHIPLDFLGYRYTVYTIAREEVTELFSETWQVSYTGLYPALYTYQEKNNRIHMCETSYRSRYDEILTIQDGELVLLESGYVTGGNTSGLFLAERYLSGDKISVFAQTKSGPLYTAYKELSAEVKIWIDENFESSEKDWLDFSPEEAASVADVKNIRDIVE